MSSTSRDPLPRMLHPVACKLGHHIPKNFPNGWGNTPSGMGYEMNICGVCGREMTRRPGGRWRAVPLAERE